MGAISTLETETNYSGNINKSIRKIGSMVSDEGGFFVSTISLKLQLGKWNTSFAELARRENKIREMMDKWKCELITDTSNTGSTTVFVSAFDHFKVRIRENLVFDPLSSRFLI